MIALARADARRFRAVARRGRPPGRPKGPAPPVQLSTAGGHVTLTAHLGDVVVALRTLAPKPGGGCVTLPLDALDVFDGPGIDIVTLDPPGREGSVATLSWEGGPAPHQAQVEPVESTLPWPEEPQRLISLPPAFLGAIHEVGRVASRDVGTKYAAHRVQLQGQAGRVVGTDGKQALALGGFTFPFAEDVLVPAVPLFGCKEIAGEKAVSIGRTTDWVFLVIGPWRVWLVIEPHGRFPDVFAAVPRACGLRFTFTDLDADVLLSALPSLPGGKTEHAPITLDLGPPVAVRAADDEAGTPAIEVPFPGCSSSGHGERLVLNRTHLGRALALGFREFKTPGPDRPVVATGHNRLYLMTAFDPRYALPPTPVTATVNPTPAALVAVAPPTPILVPERRVPMPSRDAPPAERNGHADPPPGEAIDLLAEADLLRTALTEAAHRAGRLLAGLRAQKKERRALSAAWSSLRQLNLGP